MDLMKYLALFLFVLSIVGCSSHGNMIQSTGTGVVLKGDNYKMIKTGARGESYGFYLFGLIPVVSPSFADAKESLYESVGQRLEGRSIALANQTEDKGTVWLVLFSVPSITITADVVEFNKTIEEPTISN